MTMLSCERSLALLQARRRTQLQQRSWRRKWASWVSTKDLSRVLVAWKVVCLDRRRSELARTQSQAERVVLDSSFEPGSLAGAASRDPACGSPEELALAAELGLDLDTYRLLHPACGSPEELALAAELGLDLDTYRLLREMEEREIEPEDYDMLLRLDEAVAPKTLAPPQLRRFPTELYARVPAEKMSCGASPKRREAPQGGDFDYWRLPLAQEEETTSGSSCSSSAEVGFDYWRLPLALAASPCRSPRHASQEGASEEPEVCTVCFAELAEGDQVRRLQPCGHLFHKQCIDRWLLGSSTRCPIDNQEVCC